MAVRVLELCLLGVSVHRTTIQGLDPNGSAPFFDA